MEETFTIEPKDIREGVPVTVITKDSSVMELEVLPDGTHHLPMFTVPFRAGANGVRSAQFAPRLSGEYRLRAGDFVDTIFVQPQRDLSFGVEFGIFASCVALILGVMVLWLKKRKESANTGDGSSSPVGRS